MRGFASLVFLCGMLSTSLFAFTESPAIPMVHVQAPEIKATAFVLADYNSDVIIASKRANDKVPPASLTKMLTAYVVDYELREGRLKLDDEVNVSKKAWKMPGSRMFIEVDTKVTVGDLLRGVIIQSGNDASVALAEHIAGSEEAFAQLMNQHAARLGMKNSHFVNATGLPAKDHYSTAHDMTILAQAVIRDFPNSYKQYATKWYTFNGIKQPNRNLLLWRDETVDGIKTGYTDEAGYCLVASADKNGMRLISTVLGTKTEEARASESQQLLNFGYRFFETHRLFKHEEILQSERIWMGERDHLALIVPSDVYVTIQRGRYQDLEAQTEVQPEIKAPVKKGQKLGSITVTLDGRVLTEVPLLARTDIKAAGIFGRIGDFFKMNFESFRGRDA